MAGTRPGSPSLPAGGGRGGEGEGERKVMPHRGGRGGRGSERRPPRATPKSSGGKAAAFPAFPSSPSPFPFPFPFSSHLPGPQPLACPRFRRWDGSGRPAAHRRASARKYRFSASNGCRHGGIPAAPAEAADDSRCPPAAAKGAVFSGPCRSSASLRPLCGAVIFWPSCCKMASWAWIGLYGGPFRNAKRGALQNTAILQRAPVHPVWRGGIPLRRAKGDIFSTGRLSRTWNTRSCGT